MPLLLLEKGFNFMFQLILWYLVFFSSYFLMCFLLNIFGDHFFIWKIIYVYLSEFWQSESLSFSEGILPTDRHCYELYNLIFFLLFWSLRIGFFPLNLGFFTDFFVFCLVMYGLHCSYRVLNFLMFQEGFYGLLVVTFKFIKSFLKPKPESRAKLHLLIPIYLKWGIWHTFTYTLWVFNMICQLLLILIIIKRLLL